MNDMKIFHVRHIHGHPVLMMCFGYLNFLLSYINTDVMKHNLAVYTLHKCFINLERGEMLLLQLE